MKSVLIAIVLFFSTLVYSQEYQKNIDKDFNDYYSLISKKDFEKAMDYINPKFFELIKKEDLIEQFKTVFSAFDMEYKLDKPTILSSENIKKIQGTNYVKMLVNTPVAICIPDMVKDKEKTASLLKTYKAFYGENKVYYDENTGYFNINTDKPIIASTTDDALLNWKFITVDNDNMKDFLKNIIPQELLK